MEENLDAVQVFFPPTRRAAERRTRSSRAKVPRGSTASREQQQSIRLVTNAWTRVSLDWWVRDREPPEADVGDSSTYVQSNLYGAKSELRIKHGTEVVHTSREGYVREERGEPLTVNLRELPVTTKPDGLSLRGIEKKAVSSHPGR